MIRPALTHEPPNWDKCDGHAPCQRCQEAASTCEYRPDARQTKDELREEIRRLTRSAAKSANPQIRDNEKSSGFQQLLSWRSCVPDSSALRARFNENQSVSTHLSFPPLPLDSYVSESQVDGWTRTGWTKAHVRHLFDATFTWDYLPFCLLRKALFIRDYDSGSTQFCSSALVHATLAISSRLINENDNDRIRPSGWLGSKFFFSEAEAALQTQSSGEARSLPDIQALGVLSLYHIRCGLEEEAFKCAVAFARAIIDLCNNETDLVGRDEEYLKTRSITYNGAVSLVRMLELATGRAFNETDPSLQEARLDQNTPEDIAMDEGHGSATPDLRGLQFQNAQPIAERLFQLTDWVHNVITGAQSGTGTTPTEAYNKCLDWYNNIFGILYAAGGRTPFALFIHMYYHFCILCMFRPFIGEVDEGGNTLAHEMCIQATQSLLALAQAYDDLFTLKRVPALMPYFVCTAGLFFLAMEDSGLVIDLVHLRVGNNDSQLFQSGTMKYTTEEDGKLPGQEPNLPYVQMPAVAHARLILAKMCSTHPAAVTAERILGESTQDNDHPS